MKTAARLRSYEVFDEPVIEAVSDAAEWQNRLTFDQLASRYAADYGPHQAAPLGGLSPVEYHDIYDVRERSHLAKTMLYNAPMAIPADQNMAMRAIRLAGVLPDTRIIVAGNPAAIGNSANLPPRADRQAIAAGDFRPLARPLLKHLSLRGLVDMQFVGYSLGADLSAAASAEAAEHGIKAHHGVWMESASVAKRGLMRLLRDFAASGKRLEEYIKGADSAPLDEARKLADTGLTRYALGLARLSNLAIAQGLVHGRFQDRAMQALNAQPGLVASMVWGEQSELLPAPVAQRNATFLKAWGRGRLLTMQVPGMHHAGGDDIDLHAAIVLQNLRDQRAIEL